mgnify:FL=1|tara:strand:+ start:671 stop:862 length:192 start_codon:yes stop_codon:yes gene_type:complete
MAAPFAAILKMIAGAGLASAYKKYGKKIGKEADKIKKEKEDKEFYTKDFLEMLEKRKREKKKK